MLLEKDKRAVLLWLLNAIGAVQEARKPFISDEGQHYNGSVLDNLNTVADQLEAIKKQVTTANW